VGWAGYAYDILVGTPEGRRLNEWPGSRCKNFEIDVGDTGYESVECVQLAQNRDEWWTSNDIKILLKHKKQIKLSCSQKLRK
jgi:hypothetical protein